MLSKTNRGNILMIQTVTMGMLMLTFVFAMVKVDAAQFTVGTKVDTPILTGGYLEYIAVKDQYVFAANGTSTTTGLGIRLYEMVGTSYSECTNTSATSVYGVINTRKDMRELIRVSGNYLYVIDCSTSGSYKLRKIDVTNPKEPVLKSDVIDISVTSVSDMEIKGNYMYLSLTGVNSNAIQIINISGTGLQDMGKTVLKDTAAVPTYGNAFAIYVADGYIYSVSNETTVTANATGPRIVDVFKLTDESHIDMSSWLRYTVALPTDTSTLARLSDIYVDGDYAYVSVDESTASVPSNNGIIILDIKNKANIKKYFCQSKTSNRRILRIDKLGNIIFGGSTGNSDLCTFDVSNPLLPVAMNNNTVSAGKGDIIVTPSAVFMANSTTVVSKTPLTSITDVVITSPTPNVNVTKATFDVRGTSSNSGGKVYLTVGLDPVVKQVTPDASGNWSYTVTGATNGELIIKAEIKAANVVVGSTVRTVNVDLNFLTEPVFSVSNIVNGDITATLSATNPAIATSALDVTLVMALYYDGVLVQLDTDYHSLSIGATDVPFSTTVNIPQTLPIGYALNKYSVIAYVWNDVDHMKPLKNELGLASVK